MRPPSSHGTPRTGNLAGTARLAMGRALPALLLIAVILAAATLAPPPAAEAQANDATLSGLTLSPDNNRLRPAFMSSRMDYFAWYPSSTATVTVAATPNVAAASVSISGDDDTSTPKTAAITLMPGKNTVTITVTATNGSDTETYTVEIVQEHGSPTDVDANAIMTANMTAYVWPPRADTPDIGGWSQLNRGKMSNRTFELQGTGTEPVMGADDDFTGYRMLLIKAVVNDWREYGADTVVACFAGHPTVPEAVYKNLTLSITHEGSTYEFPYRDATAFGRFAPGMCWQWARPAGLSFALGDLAVVKMFAANIRATGTVTFTDGDGERPKVGTTLRVEASVSDPYNGLPDPVDFSWTWVRVKSTFKVIPGVNSPRYTPRPDDVGGYLIARAYFRDAAGNLEWHIQARTGTITGFVPLPTPQNWSTTLALKDLGSNSIGCDNASSDSGKRCSSALGNATHIMGGVRHTIEHLKSVQDGSDYLISIRLSPPAMDELDGILNQRIFGKYYLTVGDVGAAFPDGTPTRDATGTTFTYNVGSAQPFTADTTETVTARRAGGLGVELSVHDHIERNNGLRKTRVDLVLDKATDADPDAMVQHISFTAKDENDAILEGAAAAEVGKIERVSSWMMPMGLNQPVRVSDHLRLMVNPTEAAVADLKMTVLPADCSQPGAICSTYDGTVPYGDDSTTIDIPLLTPKLSVSVGDPEAAVGEPEGTGGCHHSGADRLMFPITLSRPPSPGWHVRVDYATTDEGMPTANRANGSTPGRDYAPEGGTMTWFVPADPEEEFNLTRDVGIFICADIRTEEAETVVLEITGAEVYDRSGEFAKVRSVEITDGRAEGVISANTGPISNRQDPQNTPQNNKDQKSDQQESGDPPPQNNDGQKSDKQANSPATGAVQITGTAQVGETLSAATGNVADEDGLEDATFAYQWLADGAAIAGAASSAYTLTDGEEGKAIRVRLSFTDDAGNPESLTSAATEAVQARPNRPATGAPTITGTAQVGETLSAATGNVADEDGLDDATFAYQWLADGAAIAGAASGAYTLTDGEEGKAIRVRVSFTDDAGNAESLTSAATAAVQAEPAAPDPPAKPTNLTGTLNADGSITLTWTAPEGDVTGYQVLRRRPTQGETILIVYVDHTGSTATTYTDTSVTGDGHYVYRVKARNSAGVGPRSNFVRIDR